MMTTMYEEMLVAHAPIPAPPCAFCSKHGRGEDVFARSGDWASNDLDMYDEQSV